MSRCRICGKKLTKTFGTIGPKCKSKLCMKLKLKKKKTLKRDLFSEKRNTGETDSQFEE